MIESKDLELTTTLTIGSLESNASSIQAFVMNKLQEYTPDRYVGKAEEAKADRAVLNAAEKTLNSKRLELERLYMEPFAKFKGIISDTCKAIKQASGELDAIVKTEEEREKALKADEVNEYWVQTGFTLFDIAKVFNPKWLNKTTKMKDVKADIDAIQKKTLNDLKVIDNFPPEDVALIKTEYLNTLDITQAMAKAQELKDNRDRLAKEKIARDIAESRAQLQAQKMAEYEEAKDQEVDDLASQALGLNIQTEEAQTEKMTFALVLKGTKEDLIAVRRQMTALGVTYDKLQETAPGVFTYEEK